MVFQNINQNKIEYASGIFKGFGNPIRIRIIDALMGTSLRVKELSDQLGYPQPIISQQLKILKGTGIVKKVREKGTYRYQLTNLHFVDLIECIKKCLVL